MSALPTEEIGVCTVVLSVTVLTLVPTDGAGLGLDDTVLVVVVEVVVDGEILTGVELWPPAGVSEEPSSVSDVALEVLAASSLATFSSRMCFSTWNRSLRSSDHLCDWHRSSSLTFSTARSISTSARNFTFSSSASVSLMRLSNSVLLSSYELLREPLLAR